MLLSERTGDGGSIHSDLQNVRKKQVSPQKVKSMDIKTVRMDHCTISSKHGYKSLVSQKRYRDKRQNPNDKGISG